MVGADGGAAGRVGAGRCPVRAELRAKRMAQRQLVDGRLVNPNAAHGTWGGYTNWFCRCPRCRDANTRAMRAYLAKLRSGGAS